MTADVTQDRRVTVPTRGTHTVLAMVPSLLGLAFAPVHEGLGYRAFPADGFARTGYKVMRFFRMRFSRPGSGSHLTVDLAPLRPTNQRRAVRRRSQGVACRGRSKSNEHRSGQP